VPNNSPHVFVVRSDITQLKCDAWVLSTSTALGINNGWDTIVSKSDALKFPNIEIFLDEKSRSFAAPSWNGAGPQPILVSMRYRDVPEQMFDIFFDDLTEVYEDAFDTFHRVSLARSRGDVSGVRRLLAFPLLGSGKGGGKLFQGKLLERTLPLLHRLAEEYATDVVLVTHDEPTYALAQRIRTRPGSTNWFATVENKREHAKWLAEKAEKGLLVPFIGAGASISAGGLTWNELLVEIASRIGVPESLVPDLLNPNRDNLDQAEFLRMYFEQHCARQDGFPGTFGELIAAITNLAHFGLAPALLASINSEQSITLNYDKLFEQACEAAKNSRRILPEPRENHPENFHDGDSPRWLLKLHGTVSEPESIVLSRDDYLGYSYEREALSALVKATLFTRHLLFVGFGLNDDHFHEIVHDVNRAVGNREHFGTVLSLAQDHVHETLWKGKLEFVNMDAPNSDSPSDLVAAARELEIFLDFVLALSTNSRNYLLNVKFQKGDADSQFRLELIDIANRIHRNRSKNPEDLTELTDAFKNLGWEPGDDAYDNTF
jgi:hypothetical protein